MKAAKWSVGMRKLGTGMYLDTAGALHLRAEEICEALEAPPTPENLREAEQGAIEAIRKQWPDIKVSAAS